LKRTASLVDLWTTVLRNYWRLGISTGRDVQAVSSRTILSKNICSFYKTICSLGYYFVICPFPAPEILLLNQQHCRRSIDRLEKHFRTCHQFSTPVDTRV